MDSTHDSTDFDTKTVYGVPKTGYYNIDNIPCKDGDTIHFLDERTFIYKNCGLEIKV